MSLELPSPLAAQSGPDVTLDLGLAGCGTQADRGGMQLVQYGTGVPQRCKVSPSVPLSPVPQTEVKLLFVLVGSGTVFSSKDSSEFLRAEFGQTRTLDSPPHMAG